VGKGDRRHAQRGEVLVSINRPKRSSAGATEGLGRRLVPGGKAAVCERESMGEAPRKDAHGRQREKRGARRAQNTKGIVVEKKRGTLQMGNHLDP